MTTIDSGSRSNFELPELEEKERENERLRTELQEWKRKYEAAKKRDIAFTNSEKEVEPLYTSLDSAGVHEADLGMPG